MTSEKKAMTTLERSQHLFIVRVWCEPSDQEPPGQWRGSVEHIPSGQRIYFANLLDLTRFMTSQMGDGCWAE
jgi:hypothetical protein